MARQTPSWPKRQHIGADDGHCAVELHRISPPAKSHTVGGAQVVAPPIRLRQQKFPEEQAEPSRQPMLAPPGQVLPAGMQVDPLDWMQHASFMGRHAV